MSEYARKTLIGNVQKELSYLYKPGTKEPAHGDAKTVSTNAWLLPSSVRLAARTAT